MRSKNIFCLFFTTVLGLFCLQKSQAQAYKRICLKGDFSVCVRSKEIVNKPKTTTEYKKAWRQIQFNGKKGLVSSKSLEMLSDKSLKEFNINPQSTPEQLIKYAFGFFIPIDSNIIFSDTLNIGKLKGKYPFVDLILTRKFKNYAGYLGYSSTKARLIMTDEYLYILKVDVNELKIAEEEAVKTRKDTALDFRRLVRSIRVCSKKTQLKKS